MPGRDQVLAVVHEWLLKAENDLTTAAHTLKLGEECPTDTVCYHAQQCVEKYLKAVLVLEGIDFPKTHDLERLGALLPGEWDHTLTDQDLGLLTEYATGARYPGWGDIPRTEARRAVAMARRARRSIRASLPRRVLRRNRS
jgi:HEPN domain-containing protein